MPIRFVCTCQKRLRAPDSLAGKQVKCPGCGTLLTIPEAQPASHEMVAEQEPATPPKSSETYAPEPVPQKRETTPAPDVERYRHIVEQKPVHSWRDFTYFILILALIPLGLSLFLKKDDAMERLTRTLDRLPKGAQDRLAHLQEEEDLFSALPGGRIEGAHLPRHTFRHYLYAVLAAAAFFALGIFLVRGEDSHPWSILLCGVFTGTAGIAILLLAQLLAALTQGHILVSTNPIIMVIYWVAWAIGFSYSVAADPEYGFLATFFGFTFGVGFCEEVCKALPLIVYYKSRGTPVWHDACARGFASGAGFGIAEALLYSGRYNGLATYDVYLVRFISCIALHIIWSLSTALFLHKHQWLLHDAESGYEYIPRVLVIVSVPMMLHGLYDSALQKNMGWVALLSGVVSFIWLVWLMETARSADEEPTQRKRRIRVKASRGLA